MMLTNTRAVLNSVRRKLKTSIKTSDVICQAVLFLLCAYNVYRNLSTTVRLIVYSLMLVLSAFWLTYTLVYYREDGVSKEEKNKKAKVGRTVRYMKIGYKVILLTYSIAEMSVLGYTPLSLILLICSVVSFLFQILTTVLSNQIAFYASAFEFAIEKDFAFVDKFKNAAEKVKHPLYGVSSFFIPEEMPEEPENEKKEAILGKMRDEFFAKREEEKQSAATEKENRKRQRQKTVDAFKEKTKNGIEKIKEKISKK